MHTDCFVLRFDRLAKDRSCRFYNFIQVYTRVHWSVSQRADHLIDCCHHIWLGRGRVSWCNSHSTATFSSTCRTPIPLLQPTSGGTWSLKKKNEKENSKWQQFNCSESWYRCASPFSQVSCLQDRITLLIPMNVMIPQAKQFPALQRSVRGAWCVMSLVQWLVIDHILASEVGMGQERGRWKVFQTNLCVVGCSFLWASNGSNDSWTQQSLVTYCLWVRRSPRRSGLSWGSPGRSRSSATPCRAR